MKIVNFDKFKEIVGKYQKPDLKELLFDFALSRTIEESVLVGLINSCNSDGSPRPRTEVVAAHNNALEGERIIIGFLGRREAAKVYGCLEGITSDVKFVD